jgi:integrase
LNALTQHEIEVAACKPPIAPVSGARLSYKGIATAHGFRTLFSTCANEAGWNSDVIEKQLAHEERDEVRNAYNRAQWLAKRTRLMQWWADQLDKLRKGADVLPIKTA